MPVLLRIAPAAILWSALLGVSPAASQVGSSRLEINGETLALSSVEMARLSDLRQALTATPAIQDRALASARAALAGPDARYVFAIYALEIGQRRRDDALRAEALDVLLARRNIAEDRRAGFLGLRGDIAFRARDYATASASWSRLAEMRPNDPQAMMNLAQVRAAQSDAAGAIDLIRRAGAAQTARSQPIPEVWQRQWLSIAFNGRLAAETAAAAHALVESHPTPENWHLALVAFRQLAAPQDGAEIDLLRLMRAAGVFTQPGEYQRLAQLLMRAGFASEARATLQDGIARGVLNRSVSPTPQIMAEIERALGRPPIRPQAATGAAATVRRGQGLVLAGNRAEAEAAFRAAASSAPADAFYTDLARFWLSWLARPSAA